MSKDIALVKQLLHFADRLLEHAADTTDMVLARCHTHSALLEIDCALALYWHNIDSQLQGATQRIAAIEPKLRGVKGNSDFRLREFARLLEDDDSWLSELCEWVNSTNRPKPAESDTPDDTAMIVTSSKPPRHWLQSDIGRLRSHLNKLQHVIQAQDDATAEY